MVKVSYIHKRVNDTHSCYYSQSFLSSALSSIPEVGDLVRRKGKKQKIEFYTPVTDSLLVAGRDSLGYQNTDQSTQEQEDKEGSTTDFRQFGAAKDRMLSQRLDQASSDSSNGSQSTIDPKGYLTEMGSLNLKSDAEISDIRKARSLLKSVISTNPKHAPGI